jgi:CRISPR-associated endonuclease/helicase Cas3
MDDIEQAFLKYFGNMPFAYQQRVAATLLRGKNVLLRAPTGAGKTNAALFPFLYARLHGREFADHLIFAFPLVTLAQAQYIEVKDTCRSVAPELRVTIQTGAQREDEFFSGDIIFTTIDQVLSAYIGVPVSLPGKLANVPAAALLGAYVVFDEVHLLEPERALATALDVAARLVHHSRVLMMTATLSVSASTIVAERLLAAQVSVPPEEARAIPSQAGKQRRYVWHAESLTAAAITQAHRNRSIVVVNTVSRAQSLVEEVRQQVGPEGPEVLLLHSRFLASDRRRVEEVLLNRLGEKADGNVILVATQVIEVGLNISCSVMHTEVAPANAVLQRAGRCARFAEPKSGTVHVYALEQNDRGEWQYGPYTEQRRLVDATSTELSKRMDAVLDAADEEALVDAVHKEDDTTTLGQIVPNVRAEEVRKAQQSGAPASVRDLVRDIDAVTLYVYDNPAHLPLAGPLEAFSLPRLTIQGIISSLKRDNQLAALFTMEFGPSDDGSTPAPEWRTIVEERQARAALVLCIKSSHADYSSTVGLTIKPDGTASGTFNCPPLAGARKVWQAYGYHKELYQDHIILVVRAHDSVAGRTSLARSRLEQTLRMPVGTIEQLSHLVTQLHDVGKLSMQWQQAAWQWQIDNGDQREGLLAHTEYDATNIVTRARWQQGARTGRYRRGPHAAEGAYAVLRILSAATQARGLTGTAGGSVVAALASAIARHHSAGTEQLSSFELAAEASGAVTETLGSLPAPLEHRPDGAIQVQFGKQLTAPSAKEDSYWLYLYIARRLRLADQEGTRAGGPDR